MLESNDVVVLDTTALHLDWNLDHPWMTKLLVVRELQQFKVVIPRPVVEEHIRHYRRAWAEAIRDREDAAKRLAKMGWKTEADVLLLVTDEEDTERSYRERLLAAIASEGVELAPWPTTAHDELVQRDLREKRPFREGRGYRDALTWSTVLGYARQGKRVHFVSQNSKDFAGKKPDELHPDLQAELPGPNAVTLWPTLRELGEKHITPYLSKETTDIAAALVQGKVKAFTPVEMSKALDDDEVASAVDESEFGSWYGDFVALRDVALTALEKTVRIERLDAARIAVDSEWTGNGTVLVDEGEDAGFLTALAVDDLRIRLDAVLNLKTGTVESVEIDYIQP